MNYDTTDTATRLLGLQQTPGADSSSWWPRSTPMSAADLQAPAALRDAWKRMSAVVNKGTRTPAPAGRSQGSIDALHQPFEEADSSDSARSSAIVRHRRPPGRPYGEAPLMRPTSRRILATLAIAATAGLASGSVAVAGHDTQGDEWVGTQRADQYMGTRHDDFANGRGGPDAMQGHRGMDFLYGEAGWDSLSGGLRSDLIYGGTGSDLTTGGDAADLILEDDGDDRVNGGAGGDWLDVATGSDVVQAGAGRDLLIVYNDDDPDTLQCGAGRDLVLYIETRDAPDRYRGCERKYDIEEFERLLDAGAVEIPPYPPILNHLDEGEEESAPKAPMTRRKALNWSVRQLVASTN